MSVVVKLDALKAEMGVANKLDALTAEMGVAKRLGVLIVEGVAERFDVLTFGLENASQLLQKLLNGMVEAPFVASSIQENSVKAWKDEKSAPFDPGGFVSPVNHFSIISDKSATFDPDCRIVILPNYFPIICDDSETFDPGGVTWGILCYLAWRKFLQELKPRGETETINGAAKGMRRSEEKVIPIEVKGGKWRSCSDGKFLAFTGGYFTALKENPAHSSTNTSGALDLGKGRGKGRVSTNDVKLEQSHSACLLPIPSTVCKRSFKISQAKNPISQEKAINKVGYPLSSFFVLRLFLVL